MKRITYFLKCGLTVCFEGDENEHKDFDFSKATTVRNTDGTISKIIAPEEIVLIQMEEIPCKKK